MSVLTQVLDERWPTVPTSECYARPRSLANRWGDTATDIEARQAALDRSWRDPKAVHDAA